MYLALTVATLILAFAVYKYCTAETERSEDACLNAVTGAVTLWIIAVVASVVVYANGKLTGPLATLYEFVDNLHLFQGVGGFFITVFGFVTGDVVRSCVQYACVAICVAAPFVCWWMCRHKRKRNT